MTFCGNALPTLFGIQHNRPKIRQLEAFRAISLRLITRYPWYDLTFNLRNDLRIPFVQNPNQSILQKISQQTYKPQEFQECPKCPS